MSPSYSLKFHEIYKGFLNKMNILDHMDINGLKIKGKVILAPMCDVTTLPFRLLCKKYGAALTYTEMVFADALVMGNTRKLDSRVWFMNNPG